MTWDLGWEVFFSQKLLKKPTAVEKAWPGLPLMPRFGLTLNSNAPIHRARLHFSFYGRWRPTSFSLEASSWNPRHRLTGILKNLIRYTLNCKHKTRKVPPLGVASKQGFKAFPLLEAAVFLISRPSQASLSEKRRNGRFIKSKLQWLLYQGRSSQMAKRPYLSHRVQIPHYPTQSI